MLGERLENGVRARADGKGDPWSEAHRRELGSEYHMQDVDCLFGLTVFGHNTAERLFLEYAPDSWVNRVSKIRRFGVVALFDRKRSDGWAFSDANTLSTAFYLEICRRLGSEQPIAPRFFYVVGGDTPPWTLYELSITTGEQVGEPVVIDDWRKVWRALGLEDARRVVTEWARKAA